MKTAIIILIILVVVVFGIYLISSNNNSYQTSTGTTQVNPPVIDNSNTNVSMPTTTQTTPVTNTPVKTAPKVPVTTTPKPPVVSNASVSISNFSFNPSTLTVRVGTKVTWTNNDSVAHTITSDSGNVLNSSALSPGQSYSVIFTSSGSVSYHCSIHPVMRATIVVTN